jgi:hypothetical protein
VSGNRALHRIIEATVKGPLVEVCVVADAVEATARIQVDPPDLVLVDADVPAWKELRFDLAGIPVWLLGDPGTVCRTARNTLPVGYEALLELPLDPGQVAARVRQLLNTTASRVTSREKESFDAFLEQLDSRLADLRARPFHAPDEPRSATRHPRIAPKEPDVPTMAELLEADQTVGGSAGGVGPASADPTVDEIATRVMARLSSNSLHEIVSRIVTEVASRMAREETERRRQQ